MVGQAWQVPRVGIILTVVPALSFMFGQPCAAMWSFLPHNEQYRGGALGPDCGRWKFEEFLCGKFPGLERLVPAADAVREFGKRLDEDDLPLLGERYAPS